MQESKLYTPSSAQPSPVMAQAPKPKLFGLDRRIVLTVVALIAFIGVSSLAVLIAGRQSAVKGPVAPNAPESKPQAYIEKIQTCSLTFDIPAECNSICAQTADCQAVNPDWTCLAETPNATGSAGIKHCRLTDNPTSATCSPQIACNSPCTTDSECQAVNPNWSCETLTYPTTEANPTPVTSKACRLTTNPNSEACVPPDVTPTQTPTPTPTPTGEVTHTPTPTMTPGATPTTPPGVTVNPTTPGSPPTYTVITTVNCNDDCSRNSDCSNSTHICYNGKCRLDANPEDSSCKLKTGQTTVVVNTIPTREPQPQELIKSGPADWGTYLKVGFGALGLGALLLLFL
jgi:hypothetical protein